MLRLFAILLLVIPGLVFCQDAEQLIKEAQLQESLFHENEAFLRYADVLKKDPSNLFALWKCSELCSRIGARQADKEKMKPYFLAARNYASAALTINSNSADANCMMALALGRLSLVSPTKERVMLARDVKFYCDKAIRLDPGNFRAYHILGKWNYEVSNLNIAEKSFARLFYGKIPQASLDDAVSNFEKSRSLNPGFILNYLELARAYHRMGEEKKAVACLQILLPLPNQMYDDSRAKLAARQLLSEWQ